MRARLVAGGTVLEHTDELLMPPERMWRTLYPTPMPSEYRDLVLAAIDHVAKSGVYTSPALTLERVRIQLEARLPRGGPPVLGYGR